MNISLDKKDRQLLDVLQEEGRMSQIDLADRVACRRLNVADASGG